MQTITLKGYGTNIPPYEAIELGTYDSYGVEQLQIVPAHGWENLSIIASFFPPSGAEPIKVAVLSSGIIDVPPGATAKQSGKGIIVFAGYKANTQLISTNVAYNIRDHKDIASGDPVCPTPSVVDQIMNAAKAAQEDAEKAAQDASEAKTSANKSQENAEKAQQAAENAASAAAKAGPYADSALAAAKAAKASENATKVSENAAATSENNARISADKAKASETASKESAVAAAGSASQAETQKTAAAKSASDAQGYMQTASSAATTASASAENAAGSAVSAGNSASAAERSEQAARASEVKAAESENAAKASEQAAAESAQAALESKTAAATSEVNAAASAKKAQDVSDSLPADYVTAVNEIDTLKQQVANITPDDSTIGEKPWTSKKIVDSLCQPFEENGNPVQCYPVENYPLGVRVQMEPVQEGSGDPSPDNIRPITGRNSVTVTRCGKNLLDFSSFANYTNWRVDIATEGDTPTNNANKGYVLPVKPSKTYTISFEFLGDTFPLYLYIAKSINGVSVLYKYITTGVIVNKVVSFTPADNEIWYLRMGGTTDEDTFNEKIEMITYIQLELGTTSTPYEPYTGSTTDISLPETVYSGEMDAVSGEGQETWKMLTLDGTERWDRQITSTPGKYGFTFQAPEIATPTSPSIKGDIVCSQYPTVTADDTFRCKNGISVEANVNHYFRIYNDTYAGGTIDEWKSYLASQYAAGTPVQVCYKLAEPVPFTATGTQPIPALSGVNTLYTDADGVVVTGAEDPRHTIVELKNAIISLGGNV